MYLRIYPITLLGMLFVLCTVRLQAQTKDMNAFTRTVDGYAYGKETAPSGKEWESPSALSLNKELPKAYFFSFENKEKARQVLPEKSSYWMSLDGVWKFNWVKTPEERPKEFYSMTYDVSKWDDVPVPMSWNILGIQKDGSLKYGVPIYVNQQVIFQHQVKPGDWEGGVMRTPRKDRTTYIYRNEVGSYRRSFDVPKAWKGQDVFINFDGVDSFFYLWINGQYVGFSKNSRNLAAFNITPYLNEKGGNTVSVEVYRNSDASFLEAQDMFRLPGIFRTVSLTAKPKVHIRDLIVIPDLTDNYSQGKLNIQADLRNLGDKDASGYYVTYSLYANKLYSDENDLVSSVQVEGIDLNKSLNTVVSKNGFLETKTVLSLKNPNLWSAESPYRYTLVAELKDRKHKTVEIVSTNVGFRKVEIKDTEAKDDEFGLKGRYYYLNGKTIKLKGVNRHETNPETGKVITHQQMEAEIKLMKKANINHVRNSHYPDNPYWYFLCDKYGIYLEDEANIESHEYYYGEASLSHPAEWKNAHVARNLEMVHATINHPSVVIWSLGNEAGPGNNFVAAYDAIKKVDVSRPVQYERNNSIVDMGSNQYPSIDWVREAVKGKYKLKYPFHISEYAHSMGNAAGNLTDYWQAIESTNYFMGGAIWDWIDQAMYYYDKDTKERFLAYGGDFGDKPNDGTFVNNGLIFADRVPKPQYYEVKKVYQNIGIKPIDIRNGVIEIFNKNYFVDLSDYSIEWTLYEDGVEIKRSAAFAQLIPNIAPRQKQNVILPLTDVELKADAEYFVKIQFLQLKDQFWAEKGYVQMEEQLLLKSADEKQTLAKIATGKDLLLAENGTIQIISGTDFQAQFDNKTGTIYSLRYGDQQVIRAGEGPKLDALRAPVDNDNWAYKQWFEKGLHQLKHKALSARNYTRADGAIVLSYVVESQAPYGASLNGGTSGKYVLQENNQRLFDANDFKFTSNQVWTVYKDGSIELETIISANDESFILARLGYQLQVPSQFSNYTYYGRGPINNYADRKTAQNIERHTSKVQDQFVPWTNPQSMSNNEEVRWCALTDNNGVGVVFVAKDQMSSSALPWSEMELTLAAHPYQLPVSSGTHLHLDAAVTGLGGNSCGQGPPLEMDRVKAATRAFGLMIRPIVKNDFKEKTKISVSGDMPIAISRNRAGDVLIQSERKEANLLFQIDQGKTQKYTEGFNLRNGGNVVAWYQENDKIRSTANFSKIESVPLQVLFASSQETGEADAKNFVDNDPNTIWHTMYSVTVAQYPHWVDFDSGEQKNIKGFTYLPRQDSPNGNVKKYSIQVSLDGKTWSKTIIEGEFPNNTQLKTIRFESAVKGRFIRFTALSAQNGQDFASGAEFGVLAD